MVDNQSIFRLLDGNVRSIVVRAMLQPLNAVVCLVLIHFYNIVKKIVHNSYVGLCLLYCIFIMWNILFPISVMLLRTYLYQAIKNNREWFKLNHCLVLQVIWVTQILARIQHQIICFQFWAMKTFQCCFLKCNI